MNVTHVITDLEPRNFYLNAICSNINRTLAVPIIVTLSYLYLVYIKVIDHTNYILVVTIFEKLVELPHMYK